MDDVQEDLSWWETSSDGYLPAITYTVRARKQGDKGSGSPNTSPHNLVLSKTLPSVIEIRIPPLLHKDSLTRTW
jgi:hypothetical protein